MANNFLRHYYSWLSHFSAAQVTVFSFVIMSLIGGSLLWFSEKDRTVYAVKPRHQLVIITEKNPASGQMIAPGRLEVHTTTRQIVYKGERFIDTLFTAVSALCVTGLNTTDFSRFTLLGQIITMVLIQMGGLGIILFTSIFAMIIARGISEHTSFMYLMSGILDTEEQFIRKMIRQVLFYTLLFEGLATAIMGTYLSVTHPVALGNINPWWWSLFHSISAFNNAGFGLQDTNLVGYVTDPVINVTIASLIILGGLGYPVLVAMHAFLRGKVLGRRDNAQQLLIRDMKAVAASPVQTRVALIGTAVLLALGIVIAFVDAANASVLQPYSFWQKFLIAFFQSASLRTAGFNTIDIGSLGVATIFIYTILMYIGANPAGTAGGIKIPTVAVLYGYVKDWLQTPGQPVILMHRPVSKFAVSHAIRLLFVSIALIVVMLLVICLAEGQWLITPDPTFNFEKVIFEVVSAFGTVGMTMGFHGGVTSFSALFTPLSKFCLILMMLIGRLGPLTILASWPKKQEGNTGDFPDAQRMQIG